MLGSNCWTTGRRVRISRSVSFSRAEAYGAMHAVRRYLGLQSGRYLGLQSWRYLGLQSVRYLGLQSVANCGVPNLPKQLTVVECHDCGGKPECGVKLVSWWARASTVHSSNSPFSFFFVCFFFSAPRGSSDRSLEGPGYSRGWTGSAHCTLWLLGPAGEFLTVLCVLPSFLSFLFFFFGDGNGAQEA